MNIFIECISLFSFTSQYSQKLKSFQILQANRTAEYIIKYQKKHVLDKHLISAWTLKYKKLSFEGVERD